MKRSAASGARVIDPGPRPRTAPKAVQVLLPVWGQSYVHQFLEFGLPTMLSPRNLPYLAAALPTQLVFLTSTEDQASIVNSPLVARVRATGCEVHVRTIDHLITHTNQSTTITLAFTEAIVAAGDYMLETCFFTGMSDYIYADGSLESVLDRMLSGSSGVLVGNFQVVRETALPSLRHTLEWSGQAPLLQPRQLMAWALAHLHPATVANTVNVPFNHNAHTNRLFWRVDDGTLLGRFYLRHPICVRPETTQFLIGSSLDYSFIPEMCPSGNVASITDSDEYFVIEMQPGGHEADLLRFGPLRPEVLARSLKEWTTKEHRGNVADVHVYHAGELPDGAAAVRRESDAFTAAVAGRLKSRPRPQRGHNYWKGAMTAFEVARSPESRTYPLQQVYGMEQMSRAGRWWLRRQYVLFGTPPAVYAWDPQWPDHKAVRGELRAATEAPGSRLLLVSERPTFLSVSLSEGAQVQRVRTESLVRNPPLGPHALGDPFHVCLLELSDSDVGSAKVILGRVRQHLRPGGRVLVLFNLTHMSAVRLAVLSSPGLSLVATRLVARTVLRDSAQRASRFLHHFVVAQPWFGLPLALVLGPPVLVVSLAGNMRAVRGMGREVRQVYGYSTAIMIFEATAEDRPPDGGPLLSEKAAASRVGRVGTPELASSTTRR